MNELKRYRKRSDAFVIAVRLDLETDGLMYKKWGGEQRCKAGDWIVNNDGEVYTVDAEVFARTYRQRSPGTFVKVQVVWAAAAELAGVIETKEGRSCYEAGDFIVYNDLERTDGYCIGAQKFGQMYEIDE